MKIQACASVVFFAVIPAPPLAIPGIPGVVSRGKCERTSERGNAPQSPVEAGGEIFARGAPVRVPIYCLRPGHDCVLLLLPRIRKRSWRPCPITKRTEVPLPQVYWPPRRERTTENSALLFLPRPRGAITRPRKGIRNISRTPPRIVNRAHAL